MAPVPRIGPAGWSLPLAALADRLRRARDEGRSLWCTFDTTAGQAATGNALALQALRAAGQT